MSQTEEGERGGICFSPYSTVSRKLQRKKKKKKNKWDPPTPSISTTDPRERRMTLQILESMLAFRGGWKKDEFPLPLSTPALLHRVEKKKGEAVLSHLSALFKECSLKKGEEKKMDDLSQNTRGVTSRRGGKVRFPFPFSFSFSFKKLGEDGNVCNPIARRSHGKKEEKSPRTLPLF